MRGLTSKWYTAPHSRRRGHLSTIYVLEEVVRAWSKGVIGPARVGGRHVQRLKVAHVHSPVEVVVSALHHAIVLKRQAGQEVDQVGGARCSALHRERFGCRLQWRLWCALNRDNGLADRNDD